MVEIQPLPTVAVVTNNCAIMRLGAAHGCLHLYIGNKEGGNNGSILRAGYGKRVVKETKTVDRTLRTAKKVHF